MTSTVWVLPDASPPLSHVVDSYRRRHGPADVLYWQGNDGGHSFGRVVVLVPSRDGYDVSVKLISPTLVWRLHRHPAEVIVLLEIDLAALYAAASRVFGRRRRPIVALVESDVRTMGPTGSSRLKIAFRRLMARFIDVFVANNADAAAYLSDGLGVPPEKVHQGWWLAGLPADLEPTPPPTDVTSRGEGPVFVTAGQLIERKGHDLLLRAAAAHHQRFGPCRVWILGDGPDRDKLEGLADRLGIGESVSFFGHTDHRALKGALQAADVFVFPTLGDLVGRALVECLSLGVAAVVSVHSGAVGTLVVDGENAVVVDPREIEDLLRGMRVAADPERSRALREGAAKTAHRVSVDAGADAIHAAVLHAVGDDGASFSPE